ncbi:hypothetical protein QUF70_11095, partial [Desulfobacterales bacterium HSG17]|nr:hypothetical protein [Desulfobacterales bacterium HSG17]
MHVLNSKLQPPQCLNILDRKRLVNILKNKLQKNRIILITAGAGFGKSTLVASALVESKMQTIWYSLDSFDMDLVLFMTCLIHSIRKKYSDFGNDNLNIPSMFSSVKKRNDFLIDFIKEIEDKLNNNTVIVLDDYYLIQKANAIKEALEFILARLPKSVHFVIISRITPPIKISKFKVRQQIFELDEKKLAFTLQEIQALYSKIYKIEISTENIKKIYKKTGGWAASLILLSYAFKNRNDKEIKDALLLLKGSEQDIFNYLEENVFDNLQQNIQDFMLKTSLFSLINPGIINQVLNINNAHELLLLLVEQHLLVFPFDDNRREFYYHHLLRDFLRARLIQTKSSKDINKLHSDIA